MSTPGRSPISKPHFARVMTNAASLPDNFAGQLSGHAQPQPNLTRQRSTIGDSGFFCNAVQTDRQTVRPIRFVMHLQQQAEQ